MSNQTVARVAFCILFLLSSVGALAQIAGEDWERIALLGENTTAIAVSPDFNSDQILFAGTQGMGVFRSSNRGVTWTHCETPVELATATVVALAISPGYAADDTLFALTTKGHVYRSQNASSSFTFVEVYSPQEPPEVGTSLAIHPAYNGTSFDVLFLGTHGDGLYYSTDAHVASPAWTNDTNSRTNTAFINALAISPTFQIDNQLYVGGRTSCWAYTFSTATWTARSTGLGDGTSEIVTALHAVDSTTIYAGTENHGMYYTTNSGVGWSASCDGVSSPNTAPRVNTITYDASPARLYEGRADGLFTSTGAAAVCSPEFTYADVQAIAFEPSWDNATYCYLFVGTASGLFRFQTCSDETVEMPAEVDGTDVAVASGRNGLFMASKQHGLYKCVTDNDMVRYNNFPLGMTPEITAVALTPDYDESFEYSTETCGSQDESILFVAANFPERPFYTGVYKSTDYGNTWTWHIVAGDDFYNQVTPIPYLYDLAISPNYAEGTSDETLFLATSAGLYRWDGSTTGWTSVWDSNSGAFAVGIPPTYSRAAGGTFPYHTVFASTDDGTDNEVWVSHSDGDAGSWIKTGYDPSFSWGRVTAFAFHANFNDGTEDVLASAIDLPSLPIGGTGGVFYCSARGASLDWPSWSSRSSGLGSSMVHDIAASPGFGSSDNRLVCATDYGVYVTTSTGSSWSYSTGTPSAYSVAFDPGSASWVMAGYQGNGISIYSSGYGAAYSTGGGSSFPNAFTGYHFLPDDVWSTVAHDRDPTILFATSPSMGVFVSEDMGATFRPWNRGMGGLSGPCVLRSGLGVNMLADRRGTNYDTVWAGTETNGIKARYTYYNSSTGDVDLETEDSITPNGWYHCGWRNEGGTNQGTLFGRHERIETIPGTGTSHPVWASGQSGSTTGMFALVTGDTGTNGNTNWLRQNSGIPAATATQGIREGYGPGLTSGTPVSNTDLAMDAWDYYTIDVPFGAQDLRNYLSISSGDADLYVRYDAQPTLDQWDYRPYNSGTTSEDVCVQAILSEDFENWGPWGDNPPSGWTITDNGSAADGWNTNDWYRFDKGGSYGYVARVYWEPIEIQDELLTSPAFDLPTGMETLNLEFDQFYYPYAGEEAGIVEYNSDQHPGWTVSLAAVNSLTANMAHETISLQDYAGDTNAQIRFRYVAYNDYWWDIDNVAITGRAPNASSSQFLVPGTWHIGINGYFDSSYSFTATIDSGCSKKAASPNPKQDRGEVRRAAPPSRLPTAPSASAAWGTCSGSGVYKGIGAASKSIPGTIAVNWIQCNGASPNTLTNLLAQTILQLTDGSLIVGCDGDIFYSPLGDCANTWIQSTCIANPGSEDYRDILECANGDVLIAANGTSGTSVGGVWLSGDKGRCWMKISNGFDSSSQELEDLMVDGSNPAQYYSSTDNTGVYTRTITAAAYPTVTVLSSYSAPTTGGASAITVTGTGFTNSCVTGTSSDCPNGSAQVLFGETVVDATYVSTTTLTVTPPIHAAGQVTVRVRNPDTRLSPGGPTFTFTQCTAPVTYGNNTAADLDTCTDTGVQVTWTQDPPGWNDGGRNAASRSYAVLRSGTPIVSGLSYGTTSYTDTTGTNGVSYTYSVRFTNSCGLTTDTLGASAADVAGSAPSSLTNNAAADLDGCNDTGVQITWSQDPGDWGDGGIGTRTYDVLRSGSPFQSGLSYGTTSATDTGGTNGVSYTYTVSYNNGCGQSAATSGSSAADNVGAAPSGLANSGAADLDACSDTGVQITWSQDAGDWGDGGFGTRTYDVLRNGSPIQSGIAYGTTSATDTGGTNGVSYTYTVQYSNGCGQSAATSGSSAADALASAPSSIPDNTAADVNPCADTGVLITWSQDAGDWGDGGTGTRTYDVLRDGSPILSSIAYGTTSLTDTNGTNGVYYNYIVRYNNGCGFFAYASGSVAADNDFTPSPSISGAAANTCPETTVGLSTQGGMDAYQWYLGGSPIGGANSSTYIAAASGSYTVYYENLGCGATSGAHAVTINTCPPPPAPDGSGATAPLQGSRGASDTQILLTWDATTCPAPDYNILYGSLGNIAAYTLDGADCGPGSSGTYTWDGVPAGDLFYLVVGTDGGTVESSWGTDSASAERKGANDSGLCGITSKDTTETCP